MRNFNCTVLALAALGFVGCKSEAPVAADASVAPPKAVADEALGLELPLPAAWKRHGSRPVDPRGEVIVYAERESTGAPYLVAPKLILIRQPNPAATTDDYLDLTLADTKAALPATQAKIQRVSSSRWVVDAVEVASFDLRYTVLDPRGATGGTEVMHRTALALRADTEDQIHGIQLTVTYLAADDERLGNEVETVLRSLRFASPETQ